MKLLTYLLLSFVVLALVVLLALLIAGRLGLLRGTAPTDLGVRDQRLKAPATTPNSVSSQAALHRGSGALVDYAQIEPLRFQGDGHQAMEHLAQLLRATPGAVVVQARPDYLYVQFSTRWLRFVDDAEFWLSPTEGVIHVRSASRIGRKDFGANRARIEAIRTQLGSALSGQSK